MKRIVLFLFAFLNFGIFASAQGEQAKQSEVLSKMQALRSSLLSKDSITLSVLLAHEVTYGHTNGLIQTKSELIRSVVSGEQDYKSIEPSDMHARIYDKTAVVTTKVKVKMNFQGQPLDLNMFVTFVWVKDKKDWRLVARQAVKQ